LLSLHLLYCFVRLVDGVFTTPFVVVRAVTDDCFGGGAAVATAVITAT